MIHDHVLLTASLDMEEQLGIGYKRKSKMKWQVGSGRGDWIRTSDFHLPKMALYQAELRPDELLELFRTSGSLVNYL